MKISLISLSFLFVLTLCFYVNNNTYKKSKFGVCYSQNDTILLYDGKYGLRYGDGDFFSVETDFSYTSKGNIIKSTIVIPQGVAITVIKPSYTTGFYEGDVTVKCKNGEIKYLKRIHFTLYPDNRKIKFYYPSSNRILFNDKLIEGETIIYVCKDKMCKEPVSTVKDALQLMK